MKLDIKFKYTILCEDKLTSCFIRKFLIEQGIDRRKITPCPFPLSGCGEQYVRREFPRYLKALRSKNFNSNVLIVAIDADTKSVEERKLQLNGSCSAASIDTIKKSDRLMLFIPKRNIETWICFFDDKKVDEETDYAHCLNGHESDCFPAAVKMCNSFKKLDFSSSLNSLNIAYSEYKSLISLF